MLFCRAVWQRLGPLARKTVFLPLFKNAGPKRQMSFGIPGGSTTNMAYVVLCGGGLTAAVVYAYKTVNGDSERYNDRLIEISSRQKGEEEGSVSDILSASMKLLVGTEIAAASVAERRLISAVQRLEDKAAESLPSTNNIPKPLEALKGEEVAEAPSEEGEAVVMETEEPKLEGEAATPEPEEILWLVAEEVAIEEEQMATTPLNEDLELVAVEGEDQAPVVEQASSEETPVPAVEDFSSVVEVPTVDTAPVEEVPAVAEETPVLQEAAPVEEVPAVAEETLVLQEAAPVEEVPAVADETPVLEEATPVEEVPAVADETPVLEEATPVEEIPAVADETPVLEEATPVEEVPAVADETPVLEEAAPVEEVPAAAVAEETLVLQEAALVEEVPAVAEETLVLQEAATVEEVPAAAEETLVLQEAAPVEDVPAVADETPVPQDAGPGESAEAEEPVAVEAYQISEDEGLVIQAAALAAASVSDAVAVETEAASVEVKKAELGHECHCKAPASGEVEVAEAEAAPVEVIQVGPLKEAALASVDEVEAPRAVMEVLQEAMAESEVVIVAEGKTVLVAGSVEDVKVEVEGAPSMSLTLVTAQS